MTKHGRYIMLLVGLVALAAYALNQLPAGAKVTIDRPRPVGPRAFDPTIKALLSHQI